MGFPTKQQIESLPWAKIKKDSNTLTISGVFEKHIRALKVCSLKQFRGYCAARQICSPLSDETRNQKNKASSAKAFIKYTTEEDRRILEYLDQGLTYKETGDKLGRTAGAIEARSKRLNNDGVVVVVDKRRVNPAEVLNGLDWGFVLHWISDGCDRNKKKARYKFARSVDIDTFSLRLAEEKAKLKAVTVDVSVIPVARHSALNTMHGQYAA